MQDSRRTAYGVLLACCLMKLCTGGLAPNGTVNVFYSYIAEQWGVSIGSVSLMNTIMCLTSMALVPVAGRLLESRQPKRVVQIFFMIGISGYTLCSIARSVWWLYLCGAMIGVCNACLTYSAIPLFINSWFRSKVGFVISIATASQALGKMAFSPLCTQMIATIGWRRTYVVLGLAAAVFFMTVTACFLKNKPESMGLQPYGGDGDADATSADVPLTGMPPELVYRTPAFALLMGASFLAGYCLSVSTCIVAIAKTSGALSSARAGLAASAVGLGMLLGEPVMGKYLDREKRFWIPSLLFCFAQACGMMLLANIYRAPKLVLPASVFVGAGIGATTIVMIAYVSRAVFGPRTYGAYYPKFVLCITAANAACSYISNFIYDKTGTYATVLYVMAGMSVVIFLCVLFVYSQRRRIARQWV